MADPTAAKAADGGPAGPRTPAVIGLVGGVAAGKTTVAKLFAEHGIRHIDADAIGREVSRDPAVVAAIAADFGPEVRSEDGGLDRARLGELVFAAPARRRALEAILHPLIRQRIRAELAEARDSGVTALLDVPLLFEAGLCEDCDTIVFVDASPAVRRARADARGWADGELARREQSQLPLEEKRARSQHVIANDDDLATTRAAVAALLRELAKEVP